MIKASAATTLGLLALALSACAHSAEPATLPAPVTAPDYATAPLDRSTPEATAYALMIAMYRGDAAMVDKLFTEDGVLRRLRPDGTIVSDARPAWQDWVATLEIGQAEEELFDVTVEQFGKLASVWAPFVIRIDGEVRGCGVNQFTMVDVGEDETPEWRIVAGIDVQGDECELPND